MGTLKLQNNRPLYNYTGICTLAIDGGCYIWYTEEGPGQAEAYPILAVPNVTAHQSMASCAFQASTENISIRELVSHSVL